MSHPIISRKLYDLASSVIARSSEVSHSDCRLVSLLGLVEWNVDCDGYLPSPTDLYIYWMEFYEPSPQAFYIGGVLPHYPQDWANEDRSRFTWYRAPRDAENCITLQFTYGFDTVNFQQEAN